LLHAPTLTDTIMPVRSPWNAVEIAWSGRIVMLPPGQGPAWRSVAVGGTERLMSLRQREAPAMKVATI